MSGWNGEGRSRIRGETLQSVLDCMNDESFRTLHEIAVQRGRTDRGTLFVLQRLHELRRVERATESIPGGGRKSLWRRVPDGSEAPLYDSRPGLDARVLDAAMGGFTYARKRANS